ncbi:tyrosine-type recombinase/integrase [Aliarcobacter butzleri]|uniref:tyrosine-type recombinase/integrase n=1 Tax=Aliarcobacter butzleri TaxID=28197 RepID=UPI001EDBB5B6|nr:tyrosine-type recombinase/integrase [Aliarcobacter butzleri]MCG3692172.1 site-specific integrase [Aliarcobacter butzleri]
MAILEEKTLPFKIKLEAGDKRAQGMYILLKPSEEKYTAKGVTATPNRNYKIEIAVEAIYKNKRCRGKKVFNITKGTSIIRAVENMIAKRNEMITILKEKGTLKTENIKLSKIDPKDRSFKNVYQAWINVKRIDKRANTIRVYEVCYKNYLLNAFDKMIIDDITETHIQNLINEAIEKKKKPTTIKTIKLVMQPILELNDVMLNWKKIVFPKHTSERKFKGSDEDALKISKALLTYEHPIMRGIFTFLITGRRINEVLQLKHEHINYKNNTFTILAENSKNKKEHTFKLLPILLNAIKEQKTTTGRIFPMGRDNAIYHFKKCLRSINIHNMVMHDLRSMVGVVSLRNGADIFSVSKMLSHTNLSTTQRSYLTDGSELALKAQSTIEMLINSNNENIIEIEDNKFLAIKKLYPNATDEQINQAISILEQN